MRVLHVIPFLDPVYGGPPVFLVDLAERLASNNVDIAILTTYRRGESFGEPIGVEVIAFRCDLRWYRLSFRLLGWLMTNSCRFDVVHLHYLFNFPTLAAAAIFRLRRIPYLLQPHGVLNSWGLVNRRPVLKRLWIRLFERRIISRAATVIFASEQEKAEAGAICAPASDIVIPYGIRVSRNEMGESVARQTGPAGEPWLNVLFLSRLDPKKGLELLFPAWSTISRRFPRARLFITGSGAARYEKRLRRLVTQYGISTTVSFTGFVSPRHRWGALAAADVFILPSYSESFGIVVLEALATGKPVVLSTGVALSRTVVEAGAGLITEPTEQGIIDALTPLLADAGMRSAMAGRARECADRFVSIDGLVPKFKRIYENLARYSHRANGNGKSHGSHAAGNGFGGDPAF